MRERLTLAFIVLTVLLLLGAGAVRSYVLRDVIREQEAAHLTQEVELVAAIVDDRVRTGDGVDPDFLEMLVGNTARLEYAPATGPAVVVHGEDYTGNDAPGDDLSATASVDGATVTLSQSGDVITDIVGRDLAPLAALLLLIAAVAGIAGFLIATALSAPFKRLAVAAGALGRGRFDLELPRTRIPEARAISNALRTSALQLEDRVHREREFAEHASHVLRTPLTGLRLELEELSLRDDVPDDVRAAAVRGLSGVEEVGAVAGELVALTRRDSLVAGSELPLADLATQLAQRWADRLAVRNRTLTAAAEGDLALTYTPGPVEHVTDLLLADVVRRETGAVRIVFHGEEGGHLRIRVECEDRSTGTDGAGEPLDRDAGPLVRVRTAVESLGGRVTGDRLADGVEILLPRR